MTLPNCVVRRITNVPKLSSTNTKQIAATVTTIVRNIRPPIALNLLQLRVFLHQFLQSESGELYRNLGGFSFAFALVDDSFAVFRMFYALSGTKRALSRRLFHRDLRTGKFLPARSKEIRNVVDGVVLRTRIGAARLAATSRSTIASGV